MIEIVAEMDTRDGFWVDIEHWTTPADHEGFYTFDYAGEEFTFESLKKFSDDLSIYVQVEGDRRALQSNR
jgi:hypothetical protein